MTDALPDLDDYEFFEPLGRGTLGVVYRARDRRTNGLVALKWCPADKCQLYDAALYAVYDPVVFVPVSTVGVSDDFVYDVSEYQAAGSLAARLNDLGPMSAESAAKLVWTLCGAVEQLHAAGLVQSRLKPTDVLFTDKDQPRLSDWKLIALTPDNTDSFRPPEPDRTIAGDIYRLGGILYAALTAQAPLRSDGSLQEEPVAPQKLNGSVPHPLQDICLKCLSRSPTARYATVAQLADDLNRFLSHRPLTGIEDEDSLSPWQWLSRYPLVMVLPLGAVACGWFPLPVAAGVSAAALGVFVTPVRCAIGPILGTVYGTILWLVWLSGGRLVPVPSPWAFPHESGWLLPWLQRLVDGVRSPVGHAAAYLVAGSLTGWAWQSLKGLDQRQRLWTAGPYLLVLIAAPWLIALDGVFDEANLLWSHGVAASLIAVAAIPCGMLLAQVAWRMTVCRTTLGNARLAALLGVVLAALTYVAAPMAWRTESLGGRRPIMLAALLPRISSPFGTESAGPVSSLVTASATHLAPLGLVAAAATVLLSVAGTFPRAATVVSFMAGLGAVGVVIVNTIRRDPGIRDYLPGDEATGTLFLALGAVIAIALVAQHLGAVRSQPKTPPPEMPAFTVRVLIAACAAGLLLMVFCAMFAGLSQM